MTCAVALATLLVVAAADAASSGPPGPDTSFEPSESVPGPVGNGTVESIGNGAHRRIVSRGTVRGVVASVDVASGRLVVHGAGRDVLLRGVPSQLADLVPGERLTESYDTFGIGANWLSVAPARQPDVPLSGPVTGTIVSADHVTGTVVLKRANHEVPATLTFHAHPDQLQTVQPGQVLTLWFRRVGAWAWLQRFSTGPTVQGPAANSQRARHP